MKKIIGSISISATLLLSQVSPIFASTSGHLGEAQVAAQQAVCLLGVALNDTTPSATDAHVMQADGFLHATYMHLEEAQVENINQVWWAKIGFFLGLTDQTDHAVHVVFSSGNVYKHFRVWAAHKLGSILNDEIREIVDVTQGACG